MNKIFEAPKNKAASTPQSICITILGSLAVVLMLNIAAWFYLRDNSPNLSYQIADAKWNMLLQMNQPVDWLILGDSSGNNGGVPDVIEHRLGGTSVNLSIPGAVSLLNQAWMLQLYVEKWGRPKGVILLNSVNVGQTECGMSMIARVPLPLTQMSRLSPKPWQSGLDLIQLVLFRYIPVYSENVSLSTIIRTPWRMAELRQQLNTQADGFTPLYDANPDEFQEPFRSAYLAQLQEDKPVFSQCVDRGYTGLAQLSARHDIPMYAAHVPAEKKVSKSPIFSNYYNEVQKQLETYAQMSPQFHVVPTAIVYPREKFNSLDHLILPAAIEFNEYLASEIKRLLDVAIEKPEQPSEREATLLEGERGLLEVKLPRALREN